ncbi:membrane fusion protein, multidrug efflux system [Rhizobium sp. NFR07]|uniref:efflux RND transporter periplasmic adaptor subunit n=1 Tax=Rhizobium sp. NFR07 TaxID=1566262 RepID=UPI0008F18065|nr:efflux RND transporter periplasmic adaptor subunit [Rhizobium sp. NFR07]SFB31915.1 membrane fusion protein, multidrug efflux system [Rhizobium sp. NFR07]
MVRLGSDLLSRVVLLVLLSTWLAGCEADAQQPAARVKPQVSAQTLHRQAVTLSVELPGRTSAHLVAEVRPRVTGIVRQRTFEEGGIVEAGDVLYELDPTPFEAAYRNAQAALQRAESAVPSARARFERYQTLSANNAVSRQEFDEAQTQMLQAEADVAAAESALETARIELDYTKVRAPIAGRLDASNVTQGALVTQDQSLALTTIRQMDIINVDLVRSSASLLALNKALASQRVKSNGEFVSVELQLEDGTHYPHPGKLQFHASAVSQSTGMVSLRVVYPNPEGVLLPGMYVRALVEEGYVEDSFLVPQRAVSRTPRGEATARFINDQMKVEERVISVDRSVGNSWLVTGGVRDGDRVVVEGVQRAGIGQEVEVSEVIVDEDTGEVRTAAAPDAPAGGQGGDAQVSIRNTVNLQ